RVPLEACQLLAGFEVPHSRGSIVAAGERPAAVGGQGHAGDGALVSPAAKWFPSSFEVPQVDGVVAVPGAGESALAVGGEGHAPDPTRVAGDAAEPVAGRHFPPPQRTVVPPGKEELAVRRERHAADVADVSRQHRLLAQRLRIPEADRAVPATAGDHLAVRAEGRAPGVRRPGPPTMAA